MFGLLALNPLGRTDIIFFCVLAGIVVLCVAAYFLVPVINKKQYRELRENLKKRESAFKSNIQRTDGKPTVAEPLGEDLPGEETPEDQDLTFSDDMPIDLTEDEER